MSNNVVLIGMPGAGKSTVGVVLAKILGKDFVDADLLIQNTYGRMLQELIDEEGARGFVALENSVLSRIMADNSVIATGGSAVYSREGMQHLASIGHIVYLRISFEEMQRRLDNLDERGIVFLQDCPRDLLALYNERAPLYEAYAETTVDVDDLTLTEVAQELALRLQHLS